MIEYRALSAGELTRELFRSFIRRQVVTKCWRREQGEWVVRDTPFIDDWSEEDYGFLVFCLTNTVNTGGLVLGGFFEGELKGFVSVEPELFGGEHRYLDLTSIHVSEDMRGRGMGAALFAAAKDWARDHGGKKLYISAHSAVESHLAVHCGGGGDGCGGDGGIYMDAARKISILKNGSAAGCCHFSEIFFVHKKSIGREKKL